MTWALVIGFFDFCAKAGKAAKAATSTTAAALVRNPELEFRFMNALKTFIDLVAVPVKLPRRRGEMRAGCSGGIHTAEIA